MSGGEAGGSDRTNAGSFDDVDGSALAVSRVANPGEGVATSCASYGPSEGSRPPQDDIEF